MRSFLRQHWPWIVLPLALVLGACLLLLWLAGDPRDSPLVYPLF